MASQWTWLAPGSGKTGSVWAARDFIDKHMLWMLSVDCEPGAWIPTCS